MSPSRLFLWFVTVKRALLIELFAFALILAIGELAVPLLLEEAVDVALSFKDSARLDHIGLAMLGIIVFIYVFHLLLLRTEANMLQNGMFRLRQLLYSRILQQPLAFFSKSQTGDLMHRVVNDTDNFNKHASYLFSDLPFEFFTVIGVIVAMFLIQPVLAVVILVFLGITSVISFKLGRPLPTLKKKLQKAESKFTSRLQEVFSGIKTVKVFGLERYENERLDKANEKIVGLESQSQKIVSWLDPVFDLMEMLGVIFIVWFGAHLIIDKTLTPGGLVAFIAYMELLAGPIGNASKYYRHYLQCRAVAERIGEFVGSVPEVNDNEGNKNIPHDAPAIVFDHVNFTYPNSDRQILTDLSFEIRKGETVALMGRNGSGKTTVSDMVLKFHEPDAGKVLIDGVDLSTYNTRSWRNLVGIMSQEAVLFHDTIENNIAYGNPGATREQIEKAAKEVGLDRLIERLPNGMKTIVGDRGSRFSGGERQRIALARLFLKDPCILILDEPTTHMDVNSLAEMMEILSRFAKGRTTILIEHHPEMLAMADREIVIDKNMVG